MRRRISLQSLITLSVLSIGLLSGTIGLAYAYWQAKQSLQSTIGLTFQELARQSADNVALILTKEIEWVERLSALREVRLSIKGGERLPMDKPPLRKWREEQGQYFQALAILDREGRSVGGVTSEVARVHYRSRPWWPVIFDQRRPWAGNLQVDQTSRPYWEVAVPIFDEDRTVLGALKVVIGGDGLFSSILRSRIGETGHVMVVDAQGVVLACPILPSTQHAKTGIPLASRDKTGKPIVSAAMWTEVENDTHGAQGVIVGVSPIVLPSVIVQEGLWYILVRQDPSETYAPLHLLLWKLAAFWVGAVGLVALFRWRLTRRIVQPINALVERIRFLGQGDHSKALPAQRVGIVEIDTLAASFDDLADRLQTASKESQQYVQELERANLDIARSEEHYRTLWDHSVDSKLIVNASGIVQDVNRRGEMKLGYRSEDLIGSPAANLLTGPDRGRFQEMLREVLSTRKEKAAGEVRVSAVTGTSLTMELDLVPLEQVGSVTAIVMQLSDLTEKKQLEQQLLRSERLASLSQFASMFAHDIRNPLAGIKKTLELFGQQQRDQAQPLGPLYEDLRFTTDLLLGMINDMLDVYQESYSGLPLITSTFSVRALILEVVRLFSSEAEARHVQFRLELPEESVTITADRRRLQRVAMNLIHNALKYSPSQGVISVIVSRESDGEPHTPFVGPGEPAVLIRFEDEGPGIEPEELPHIFEMFFRKKDGHDLRIGRGLGLHFCQLVVKAHNGHIWANNRPEGGAMFAVALPAHQEQPCQPSF